MGFIGGIGRIILILLNLIILLVSMALIAGGVVVKFFTKDIMKFLGPMDSLLQTASKPTENLGLGGFKLTSIADFPMLSQMGVALIAFGCVLLALSFCGCCGACYKFRPLLMVYMIVLAVLVIAQATIGGLFLTKDSSLHKTIKDKLSDQMHTTYKTNSDDVFSMSINVMNFLLDCCGINGPSDFENNTPVQSCCMSSIVNQDIRKCATPSATDPNFNTKGCYEKLQDEILKSKLKAAIILAAILLIQVILIVFAALIFKEQNSVGPI